MSRTGSQIPQGLTKSWTIGLDHSVTVRPIRPEDAGLEVEFLRRLSPESLYNRVFSAGLTLTRERLDQLTRVDYSRDMALIATVTLEGFEVQIGVVRYARLGESRSCEFAVTVSDQWQGCGIGLRLMQELIAAATDSGLTEMSGDVLAVNRPMLALARKLGMRVLPHPDGSELRRVVLALAHPEGAGTAAAAADQSLA